MNRIGKTTTSSAYKKIVVAFAILTVFVLGFIAYFSFSKTTITLTIKPKAVTSSFDVQVKKNPADDERDAVLAGSIEQVQLTQSETFTPSSEAIAIDGQAEGVVTIYNNWSQDQQLAATTRLLSSDGVLFHIENYVVVPAGAKVENIAVYADQKGKQGDIGPSRFTIPGLWPGIQDKIFAESSTAMTGGTKNAHVITALDLKTAADTLESSIKKEAKEQIETALKRQGQTVDIPLASMTVEVIKQTSSAEPNEETQDFTMELTAKVVACVVNRDDLMARGVETVKAEIRQDEQLLNTSTAVNYSIKEYNANEQTATLLVTLEGKKTPGQTAALFEKARLKGLNTEEIKTFYADFDEVSAVDIHFSPFWVSRAPSLSDHIEIKTILSQ